MPHNFASSNYPEYYWQKTHYNWGNYVIHSDIYKKLNPVRMKYEWGPGRETVMPFYFGVVPNFFWTYGNLDYSFHKYHRHYQSHDDWYPDRKAKTLGAVQGGMGEKSGRESTGMTLQPRTIPRGCYREIRNYNLCKDKANPEACFHEKLSIMEVCPEHVLEGLREKRKHYLRAEVIDNETYKRAMTVSSFNKGRSVSDLKLKTWDYGSSLRSDSYYADDRWDATKYSHPHRYDNVNFPEQEYSNMIGGTVGEAAAAERERHTLDFTQTTSKAIQGEQAARRAARLSSKEAAAQVSKINGGHH